MVTPILIQAGHVAEEHDLAYHAFPPEQLVRTSCLGKGKSLRDQRLDLFLLKEVKEGEDPAALQGTEEERLALFRRVRNEIRDYLKTLPANAD